MRVRFTGEIELPVGADADPQLIRDCTISTIWSHVNDGPYTEPIIERLNLKIEEV